MYWPGIGSYGEEEGDTMQRDVIKMMDVMFQQMEESGYEGSRVEVYNWKYVYMSRIDEMQCRYNSVS